jgi:hypothetical protein
MKFLGDFAAGAVIYDSFTTYQPSTGASMVLAGTPILQVYKDDSATQWTTVISAANGTLSTPDSSTFTNWKLDTSADGTFFAAGHFFSVVITTGTVDSVSVVGSVVASFSIGMGQSTALRPATAGRTIVVDANGLADVNAVKVGPTGSGTAQTARDLGTSVLLSVGTGTGQVTLASGILTANANGDFTATQKTTLNTATGIIDSGTASAIAAGTITLATGHSFGTNTMAGATVMAYGSTQGYWQSNTVLSNSNASASVLTLTDNWVVTPSGTVTYQVLGSAPVSTAHPPGVALKVINTTTLTGDGSATPWGPA